MSMRDKSERETNNSNVIVTLSVSIKSSFHLYVLYFSFFFPGFTISGPLSFSAISRSRRRFHSNIFKTTRFLRKIKSKSKEIPILLLFSLSLVLSLDMSCCFKE